MRIKEQQICNKKVMQIYLKKQEAENSEIKEKIKNIKMENINVVLFVSGDAEADITIKRMVDVMKNIAVNS